MFQLHISFYLKKIKYGFQEVLRKDIDRYKMLIKKYIKKIFKIFHLYTKRDKLIPISLKTNNIEILYDLKFQASVNEVANYTLLDTNRLANLWMLSKLSNPKGAMIEIGAFRGGGSLHISNSNPDRKMYICDSFRGFEKIDEDLDDLFTINDFKSTTEEELRFLFDNKKRSFEIINGFFPQSCLNRDLSPISFAHLDVDVYKATKESLEFLNKIMIDKSLIVIDDYLRQTKGIKKAVSEFIEKNKNWIIMPMFPSQGLLIHRSFFN